LTAKAAWAIAPGPAASATIAVNIRNGMVGEQKPHELEGAGALIGRPLDI
jgi:hypothetical protein